MIRIRTRGQWFHIRHLQHLVEVDNNLSDLEAAGRCINNPDRETIAAEGQKMAYKVLNDLGADVLSAIRAVAV